VSRHHITLLGRHMGLVGFGNAISKLLMFVANIWIANHLLEQGYGIVSVAFAIVNYLSLVAFSGVDTITTRLAAEADENRLRQLTVHLYALRLVMCILLIAVTMIAGICVPGKLGMVLLLYSLSFVPQIFYTVHLFYGAEWSWPVTLYFIGGRVVYVGLLLVGVSTPGDIYVVPLAFGAAILVENAFLLGLWLRRMGTGLYSIRAGISFTLWKAAVPVTFSNAALLLHENAAIVLLYIFAGSSAAGMYNASYRLVYIAISLATLASYVFLARISRVLKESKTQALHVFRIACLIAVVLGVCGSVAGFLLARPVVELLYVPAFLPSAGLLVLAVWQMAAAPVRVMSFQMLNACHRQTAALPLIVAGSIVSVILISGGIWLRGMNGAVLGTVAGEALLAGLLFTMANYYAKAEGRGLQC